MVKITKLHLASVLAIALAAVCASLMVDYDSAWDTMNEVQYSVLSPDGANECTIARVKGNATVPKIINVYIAEKGTKLANHEPVFSGISVADMTDTKSVEVVWDKADNVQIRYFDAKSVTYLPIVRIGNKDINVTVRNLKVD